LRDLPEECAELIRGCVHCDRRRRFSDAKKVLEELRQMQWL
jgi:hypothetical protein